MRQCAQQQQLVAALVAWPQLRACRKGSRFLHALHSRRTSRATSRMRSHAASNIMSTCGGRYKLGTAATGEP